MTDLFTREGTAYTGTIVKDAKGRLGFMQARTCGRCGGAGGADKWAHTGWTCFDCGGKGTTGMEMVRLYTGEKLAKLNAAQAKAQATRLAKAQVAAEARRVEAEANMAGFLAQHGELLDSATPYLERSEFLADVVGKARQTARLTEGQANALRNTVAKMAAQDKARENSEHVGKVGERITATVTVERVAGFYRENRFSFNGPEYVHVIGMRDQDGNMIVSMSPRFSPEKGKQLTIKATVKEHGEFRGEKQTIVQRVAS